MSFHKIYLIDGVKGDDSYCEGKSVDDSTTTSAVLHAIT